MDPPSDRFLEWMGDADWSVVLPRLAAYAERRLRRVGWASGHDAQPSRLSVMEAVNMAIQGSLEGSRQCSDERVDPEAFLCGVIRSIISGEKKRDSRSKVDLDTDAVELAPNSVETMPDSETGRTAILEAVGACLEGDAEAEELYVAILDGATKREELAESLRWSPEQVSRVRTRLKRRVESRFPKELAAVLGSRKKS